MVRSSSIVFGSLVLLGCGGRYKEPVAAPDLDAFVGTWSGSYGIAGQATEGRITIHIERRALASSTSVELRGTATDTRYSEVYADGTLDEATAPEEPRPNLEVILWVPDEATGMNGGHSFSGRASLDGRGHLIVTHETEWLTTQEDFDLAPVAS